MRLQNGDGICEQGRDVQGEASNGCRGPRANDDSSNSPMGRCSISRRKLGTTSSPSNHDVEAQLHGEERNMNGGSAATSRAVVPDLTRESTGAVFKVWGDINVKFVLFVHEMEGSDNAVRRAEELDTLSHVWQSLAQSYRDAALFYQASLCLFLAWCD